MRKVGRISLGLMLWLSDRYVCKGNESERWRHEVSADAKTEKETEEGDRERQRMTAHHSALTTLSYLQRLTLYIYK